MNSWHNVNLVHILGFKMLWPNLKSKKPITKSPTRTRSLKEGCVMFFLTHHYSDHTVSSIYHRANELYVHDYAWNTTWCTVIILAILCMTYDKVTPANTYLFTFQKGNRAKKILFLIHFHPLKSLKPLKISYFKIFIVTSRCIPFTLKYIDSKRKFRLWHQVICFYSTKIINNSRFS